MAPLRHGVAKPVGFAVLTFIVLKLLVFALGYEANLFTYGETPLLETLTTMFNLWDAPHYLDLARNWYVATGDAANFIVFFPLYPVLIRLITLVLRNVELSALLASNASSIMAAYFLYRHAELEYGPDAAQRAVVLLAIFPTAYFLSAPYTEGLFLALAAGSLYNARRSHWPLAGVFGFLAVLTRMTGLALIPALLAEYLHQKDWRLWGGVRYGGIIWSILPVAGFLLYMGINSQVTGNPLAFVEIQRVHWYNTLDPIAGLQQSIEFFTSFPDMSIIYGLAQLGFAVFGLLMLVVALLKRIRLSYQVFMLFTFLLAVSTSFWISVPRYIMAMFPMFILLGELSKRKVVYVLLSVAFSALLVYFTTLFTLRNWAF